MGVNISTICLPKGFHHQNWGKNMILMVVGSAQGKYTSAMDPSWVTTTSSGYDDFSQYV